MEDYNIWKILDYLYLGNIIAANDEKIIIKHNIKTIITIMSDDVKNKYKNIEYIHFFLYDDPNENIDKYFSLVYNIIEKQKLEGNILIHCHAGISRSWTIVLWYIMKKFNLPLINAFIYVKNRRFIINPNIGFIKQLQNYEKKIGINTKKNEKFDDTYCIFLLFSLFFAYSLYMTKN